MSTLALSALDALRYVKKPEAADTSGRQAEETLRQDTLKAWEQYQTTGLHANAAEVDAWLAQLEQGHDVEPPACHV